MQEIIDKHSGAILFKKDPNALRYEEILEKLRELDSLKSEISKLKKRLTKLEKTDKTE